MLLRFTTTTSLLFKSNLPCSSSFLSTSPLPESGARHVLFAQPKDLPGSLSEFVSLNNLRDLPGSRKTARRLGRGQGSSKGKLCGRGMKGQGQRSKKPRPGFEGGQTPLYKRVKKTGFSNEQHGRPLHVINLSQVQALVDRGRLDVTRPVTLKALYEAGLFSRVPEHGVKLCSAGALWFEARLDLYLTSVSDTARKVVEGNGGKVTTVYYNPAGLRAFVKGEGAPFPGVPKPLNAHAPPALAQRFDLPRAPQEYPAGAFESVQSFIITSTTGLTTQSSRIQSDE